MRRVVALTAATAIVLVGAGAAFGEPPRRMGRPANPELCEARGLFFDPMTRTCTETPSRTVGPGRVDKIT